MIEDMQNEIAALKKRLGGIERAQEIKYVMHFRIQDKIKLIRSIFNGRGACHCEAFFAEAICLMSRT